MSKLLLNINPDAASATNDTIAAPATIEETVEQLSKMDFNEIWSQLLSSAIDLGLKILIALIVYWIGKFLIDLLYKFVKTTLERRKVDASINSFLLSLVRVVLMFVLIITIIGVLGINTSSFVALFASAGVAIGMALSGTLQNFAGGVMILLFKPYKIGDWIEAAGVSGGVKEIQIFNTILTTADNKIIIVPNGKLSNDMIINYSKAGTRRVDWSFGIAYGDDYDKAKAVLTQFINDDKRILKDPAPAIVLNELADSSIQIVVRAWVNGGDYWDVLYTMNERVYKEFGKHGLSFPFPQMDVHITKE
ncbi:MAG: mechanosensitive ion channel [Bacteroidales bacterium]|nr:mechanosensitive ion channel [Bacteroidales bacterium]